MYLQRLCLILLLAFSVNVVAVGIPENEELYYNEFNPAQPPWLYSQPLNIEEVFKNYQYVQILRQQDLLTVNYFVQGQIKQTQQWRLEGEQLKQLK